MRIVTYFFALVAFGSGFAPACARETVDYIVKQGDSLTSLADRYMVRPDSWRMVAKINQVPDPNYILPNRILRIPVKLLKYQIVDAYLMSWRGNVVVGGRPATRDMKISEGVRVATSAASFATVQLADGSRVTVPSQSSVVFGKIRKILLTGSFDIDVIVEKGRAETNVSKKKNASDNYQLRTPIAVSAVRGTSFRVVYDGDVSSLTEVVEGEVGVSSAEDLSHAQQIPAGFGAGVGLDGEVVKEALLPPPEVRFPGKIQKEVDATFTVLPVSDAKGYRIQIAEDAGFVDIVAELQNEQPVLTLQNLPNGTLFARVAAIAPNGMTGLDETFSFSRRLASLSGSAESDDPGKFRFRWMGEGEGKRYYQFQLFRDKDETPVIDETGLADTSISLINLTPGTYYWRVGLVQIDKALAVENWTDLERLVIPDPKK